MKKGNLLLIVCAIFLISCNTNVIAKSIDGNGNVITKDIPVSDYHAVSVGGLSGNVSWFNLFRNGKVGSSKFTYTQGSKSVLKITTDENLFPYLGVKSSDGELKIYLKDNCSIIPTKLSIEGSSKELTRVEVSGSTDFVVVGDFNSPELAVRVSGGSDFNLAGAARIDRVDIGSSGGADCYAENLKCKDIEVGCSGGSDVKLKGEAESAEFHTSGGSDLYCFDFIVKNLSCSTSGGSDAEVHGTESMKLSASGGSDISYKGEGSVSKSSSGGADITKR